MFLKICSCGEAIKTLPAILRPWIQDNVLIGAFFECPKCGSTLLLMGIDLKNLNLIDDLKP
jgi:hypothetical protein